MNLLISKNFYDISKIPKDWNETRLKYILSISENKSSNFNDEKILSLTRAGIVVKDITNNQGQIAESYEKYILVKKGEICMNPMDLLSGWVDISSFDGITSPAYYTLVLNEGFENKFINYFLQSNFLRKTFFKLGKGVASHDNYGRWVLTPQELKNIVIFFPNIKKQKLISLYLEKKIGQIDLLIEKIKNKIELIKEQQTSFIIKTVTKGLDPNVEMKDSGVVWIGEIPKHWKVKKFSYISTLETGNTPSKTQEELYFTEDEKGFPWVKPGDLNVGFDGVSITETRLTEEGKKQSRVVPKNSILVCCIGNTSGKFSISNRDVSTNQQINSITFNDEVLPRFGLYFMDVFRKDLLKWINFVTLPIISKGDLSKEPIIVPPMSEQVLISEHLDKVVSNFKVLQQTHLKKIKLLKEYRLSLISLVVIGKFRVTEDMV